jgi:hypothetical protein
MSPIIQPIDNKPLKHHWNYKMISFKARNTATLIAAATKPTPVTTRHPTTMLSVKCSVQNLKKQWQYLYHHIKNISLYII